MAQQTGINEWTVQRIISGARVAFDPRSTAKVATTRSDKNGVASGKYLRTKLWEEIEAEKRSSKSSVSEVA